MTHINIRPINHNEIDELIHIGLVSFIETFQGTTADANLDDYLIKSMNSQVIEAELDQAESKFYWIEQGGQKAGYFKVNVGQQQTEPDYPEAMELQRFYILEAFQAQGLGGLMMDKVKELGQIAEVPFIWLGVWEHNYKAQSFYKKHGFYHYSEHVFWMGEDRQTDYIYRFDL